MSKIKVNHSKFENTANAISTYIEGHKREMNAIGREVDNLQTSWSGADYNEFKNQWNEMKGKGSTSENMISNLESYAELLRFAANKYKAAQTNAVNRADKLPKY